MSENLLNLLQSKIPDLYVRAEINLGDCEIFVLPEKLKDVCTVLRQDSEFMFDLLVSISAVDYFDHDFMNKRRVSDARFEVIYQFHSIKLAHRIRIKVAVEEDNVQLSSICDIWKGANFMEREIFDMFGISFVGHPDLRRILMYPEFKGHPLRKDYPVLGKQPRVALRHPEVHNTAKDMRRSALVKINSPKTADKIFSNTEK